MKPYVRHKMKTILMELRFITTSINRYLLVFERNTW